MAKKSTATRQANAARRSQTAAKAPAVALVRGPKETNETGDTSDTSKSPATTATPTKSVVTSNADRPRSPAVPKTAKPAPKQEPAARPEAARTQATRVARARATQRARNANLITPEHYGYVINDLKLIAALAVTMFAIIIVLHFVIPQ
ncbi:MAG: hypothetical protein ACXWQR_01960 [Ktedonobacterales bacterium]